MTAVAHPRLGEVYRREVLPRLLARPEILVEACDLRLASLSRTTARCSCPLHQGDNPSAFVLDVEKLVYHCHSCGAGGDAVGLVMELRGLEFPEAVGVLAEAVGVDLELARRDHAQRSLPARRAPAPKPTARRPSRERGHPPAAEVRGLWDACIPVDSDERVSAYLEGRGVHPTAIATSAGGQGIARAIPVGLEVPRWAWGPDGPWSRRHRLVVPLRDARGVARSLLARDVTGEARVKSAAPAGHTRAGLVMTCDVARQILELGRAPEWMDYRPEIIVTEGEIDFLAVADATDEGELAYRAAIIGIVGSSWTPEIAARIPDGARVTIATDPDEAGERYAARIVETFAERDVELARWRPAA